MARHLLFGGSGASVESIDPTRARRVIQELGYKGTPVVLVFDSTASLRLASTAPSTRLEINELRKRVTEVLTVER